MRFLSSLHICRACLDHTYIMSASFEIEEKYGDRRGRNPSPWEP